MIRRLLARFRRRPKFRPLHLLPWSPTGRYLIEIHIWDATDPLPILPMRRVK